MLDEDDVLNGILVDVQGLAIDMKDAMKKIKQSSASLLNVISNTMTKEQQQQQQQDNDMLLDENDDLLWMMKGQQQASQDQTLSTTVGALHLVKKDKMIQQWISLSSLQKKHRLHCETRQGKVTETN